MDESLSASLKEQSHSNKIEKAVRKVEICFEMCSKEEKQMKQSVYEEAWVSKVLDVYKCKCSVTKNLKYT